MASQKGWLAISQNPEAERCVNSLIIMYSLLFIQAVNDIIHGGDLVTTVCHSTPFVVDTTPPVLYSVDDFVFDETFRILVVYYNASDDDSNISKVEFGLGKTKYDVAIRRYTAVDTRGTDGQRYIISSDFETAEGVPAWIRLNVVNNGKKNLLIYITLLNVDKKKNEWHNNLVFK